MTEQSEHGTPPGAGGIQTSGDANWKSAPRLIACGMCMGTADLVPGVSGGTMAVALGIYRQLLSAISSIGLSAARRLLRGDLSGALSTIHWRFITCLGFGMVTAVVIMGKLVGLHEMVTSSPKPVYAVFFGLVLASTLLLAKSIRSWSAREVAGLAAGAALGYSIVTLVPTQTPDATWFIVLSGALAICAMILPGISGAFILLVLGKYEFIIGAVVRLELSIVLPFALGCAVGLLSFSRVLGKALDRFYDPVLAGLAGLLVGSLWRIWPYQHVETAVIRDKIRVVSAQAYWPEQLELGVIALGLAGLAAVFAIEWLAKRRGTSPGQTDPGAAGSVAEASSRASSG